MAKSKKILIIGVKGMAGHLLYNYFKERIGVEVKGIGRGIVETEYLYNLDVSNVKKLEEIIEENSFDYIINCIGILNKDAEDNPSKAIWFNSYFPHFLENITKETNSRVIHISTDCVFSGKDNGGYTEHSFKNGEGFYAQSKALGELVNNKDVTIRTSIIGPELNPNGIGLFHWFMSQPKDVILNGFTKAYWSGITTLELAKVIEEIIEQDIKGLIQVSSSKKIDKYSLLQLFNEVYKEGKVVVEPCDSYIVDKSLISIRKDFDYIVPEYYTMLKQQFDWILEHKELYAHYLI